MEQDNITKDSITERLKRGDPDALEHLFAVYKNKVYNTAVSYVQNFQDAEEITQDVFVEVFNSASKFKGSSSISTWIYRITVNKSLDFIRYSKRKKRFASVVSIFTGGADKNELIELPDFIHPGVELEMRERSAILFKAVERLPEKQKTAFILSNLENLSYSEISDVMKTSVSSVESLLFRARQNLKKYLSGFYDELNG